QLIARSDHVKQNITAPYLALDLAKWRGRIRVVQSLDGGVIGDEQEINFYLLEAWKRFIACPHSFRAGLPDDHHRARWFEVVFRQKSDPRARQHATEDIRVAIEKRLPAGEYELCDLFNLHGHRACQSSRFYRRQPRREPS